VVGGLDPHFFGAGSLSICWHYWSLESGASSGIVWVGAPWATAAMTVNSFVLEMTAWGASFWASRVKAVALSLGVALALLGTCDHIFDCRDVQVVEVSIAEAHARLPECCPR